MPWPEALTTDQQTTVESFDVNCRSFMAQLSQLCILGSKIGAEWAGGVSGYVGSLTDGDIIPNTSGLSNSQPLSKADLSNIAGYASVISDPTNSSQGTGGFNGSFIAALGVKAAGINASIGQ